MLVEFVSKILNMAVPNYHTAGDLEYSDKALTLITPPSAKRIECSTLQGLVDLYRFGIDGAQKAELFIHITSPTTVEIASRDSDAWGRRLVWAESKYPETKAFPFERWLDPETFIISAQTYFQRVKVENDDGSFVKDLDYVLGIASKISAEHAAENVDDGFTQRVAVKQGVTLKTETILRPVINLAPYRTFAEIDQVLSAFVFRARVQNNAVTLALFEGDGGRWKLAATNAIKSWLAPNCDLPIIS
jgi:hypothetical protein